MADLQLYSNAYVWIDGGGLLTQENSVTVEKKSGLNPVFTSVSGLAGMSQGASTAEITIENAVPMKDFEFNPDPYLRSGTPVEIHIIMANRMTVFKGFLTEATYHHSVNDASKLTLKALCRFSEFE